MTRRTPYWAVFWLFAAFFAFSPGVRAQSQDPKPLPGAQEQEPPEEDETLKPKEYAFNPLQAAQDFKVGAFYFKKGKYRAAARRFSEATKWDPSYAEAFLRLGQAEEKLNDRDSARAAYAKYLELAPQGKEADAVRKKLGKAK